MNANLNILFQNSQARKAKAKNSSQLIRNHFHLEMKSDGIFNEKVKELLKNGKNYPSQHLLSLTIAESEQAQSSHPFLLHARGGSCCQVEQTSD